MPDSDRLGDVGAGWRVGTTTLMNERVSLGGAIATRDEPGADILEGYRVASSRGEGNPVRRDQAVRLWIEANINYLTAVRAAAGTTIATLAYANDLGQLDGAVEATSTPAGYTLTGSRHFVLDGALADLVLVVAGADAGPSLFGSVSSGPERSRSRDL